MRKLFLFFVVLLLLGCRAETEKQKEMAEKTLIVDAKETQEKAEQEEAGREQTQQEEISETEGTEIRNIPEHEEQGTSLIPDEEQLPDEEVTSSYDESQPDFGSVT